MSYGLVGPYNFDLKTPQTCGRDALAAVGKALRAGRGEELMEAASPGAESGLYVVLWQSAPGARPVIAGFWLVPGGDYTNYGPLGPPDRVPPFAQELLDAATEEVWWQNLDVRVGKDGEWRPVIVLEWPPFFANRSGLAPPGLPFHDEEAREVDLDERETWLEAVDPSFRPVQTDIPSARFEKEIDRFGHLPAERSVVMVVRGTLRHDGRLHTGSYFMVPPELLDDGTPYPLPFEDWMESVHALKQADFEALEHEEDHGHHLGKPLMLPGERVGFHGSGWLTRSLAVWPARPGDVTVGALTDRVVQQKWIAQAWLALTSSAVVLTSVLSFSAAVVLATRPVPEPLEPPPPPAPQPALSVCSADYQEFVEEFRCQVHHLATRGDDGGTSPVCGDRNSAGRWRDSGEDLQAAYCGLLDREIDAWTADLARGDRTNFGWFAASQACFNVLGYPFPYQLRELLPRQADGTFDESASGNGRLVGSPFNFLQHKELGIQPLIDLVAELKAGCDTYRERSESTVDGAVFATHVGAPLAEVPSQDRGGAALRRSALTASMVGVNADAQVCFRRGMSRGLDASRYEAMCADAPDRADQRYATSKMWTKLGGSVPEAGPVSVIERYSASRFQTAGKTTDLWTCHLALRSPEEIVGDRRGMWDIPIPIPQDYDVGGAGVATQLSLDATLRAIRDESKDSGICWKVVNKRMSAYTPVHPLLADLDPEGWPSVEQQLCGQVCASRFFIRRSINDSAWVTRDEDLSQCVTTLPGPPNDDGTGVLDRLRLPWNEARRGEWIEPEISRICAFNVIAQDLMPPVEGGFIIQERVPKEYAGETFSGSRIVGGDQGLAARYVPGMAFGRMDSVTSAAACGHVATQCFTGVMLEVTGNPEVERYRWLDSWRRRVEGLSQLKRTELSEIDPWCVGIKDYLVPAREIAQFDTPCVSGVEDARGRVEAAIKALEIEIPMGGGE